MSQASEMLRAAFRKGDDIRDAGLTTPADITRYDDIVYGADPAWQILDVYRPKNAAGARLPVIVSVHGGGWVYGDKERYQFYCMSLAQRGFAVVNFTYRLAPEFQFPAPLEDANLAFTWLLEHAGPYGFDTEHVFAVGDSAGAHLLGLYSAICTNPAYAARFAFAPPAGFKPTAVALNCGAYVIELGDNGSPTGALMADFLPEKGSDEELYLVNVLNHVTPAFPPAFVMTACDDFLKTQAPLMAAKLAENEVPFVYRFFGDRENRLGHVFHCNMKSADAKQANDEECDFFKRFIG